MSNSFFDNLLHPHDDTTTLVEAVRAFINKEKKTCPWYNQGGPLASENGRLVIPNRTQNTPTGCFEYAYWEGDRLKVVRPTTKSEKDKAVYKLIFAEAKAAGITPYWGEYSFAHNEGKKPLEMEFDEYLGAPYGIRISGQNFYFRDNPGLFDGSGLSTMVCQNGPDIKFVWANDKFAQDKLGGVYDLAAIFAMADKVSADWHYGVKKFEYKK